jgi:hypothetical protein
MRQRIHLNWAACSDWNGVRGRLKFLKCTLYGNFAVLEGDPARIKLALERAGFEVTVEKQGQLNTCFRLADLSPLI